MEISFDIWTLDTL